MKKIIISAIMSFALLAAMPLSAQNTDKKAEGAKAKTECTKDDKKACDKTKTDNSKKEGSKDQTKCTKADEKKATCCSKDKEAKDKK